MPASLSVQALWTGRPSGLDGVSKRLGRPMNTCLGNDLWRGRAGFQA
ncbi:MAG: hypothetical protein IJK87_12645 [Prevotella sp.]|nr:hypothetical protein [Prevotella sp.]